MKHNIWRVMPKILVAVGIISMIIFIIFVTIGPLLEWVEQGSWLMYLMMGYATILYYIFIMSIVYKLSDSKRHVIHHTYAWALGIIVVMAFII